MCVVVSVWVGRGLRKGELVGEGAAFVGGLTLLGKGWSCRAVVLRSTAD